MINSSRANAEGVPVDLNVQRPASVLTAALAVARSVLRSAVLLSQRRVRLPRERRGSRLRFADGTAAVVFRESIVIRRPTAAPAVLVVAFRLRLVRGRGHLLFRRESLLNTPIFIGFPGFVSKLWLSHDSEGSYRGVYEWDGPQLAQRYARALWRVLAIGCVRGSIRYHVIPGLRRDQLLAHPELINSGDAEWWRLTKIEPKNLAPRSGGARPTI